MVTAAFSSSLAACRVAFPSWRPYRTAGTGPLRQEHVRGQAGLGARDAEIAGPLVGHGEEPADPAGDRVLGQRRAGQPAAFFPAPPRGVRPPPPPRGPVRRRPP